MPRVSITRRLIDTVMDRAKKTYDIWVNSDDHLLSPEELIDRSFDSDALLICHSESLTKNIIDCFSDRLRIVANYSVGTDHCDLEALKDRGIVVTNTPDVLSDATAEIAMLLLLGASRRAYEGDQMIRQGTWRNWTPVAMNGIQVTGKRLGIVGMGRVGQTVAKRARAFDMKIHYFNRKRLSDELECGAKYHPSLESLFQSVDMISLNCPSTPETEDLINPQSISWMRKGVILVNTARGQLIDETALEQALRDRHIAAAGLDVFKVEPGGNPKLAELQNVFLLPHVGSSTIETRVAMGERALSNLDAFFSGNEPKDRLV